ncbi:thioredoxin domain-containing protein [Verrucomicrobiaceae bacterium R5-34]|nr:thioredoxin domain-containing protein [Verrucomicrobiaceae bacterium R5-34]
MALHTPPPFLLRPATLAMAICLLVNACKSNKSESSNGETAPVRVESLHRNNLSQSNDTSSFVQSQVHSPVHWQAWSPQVFADAESEKTTVFAVIGSGTDSHSREILKKINSSQSLCNTLNKVHTNILVDANQHPDLAFLVAALNINTGNTVTGTMLVWLSYEGVPISWASVSNHESINLQEVITRMSTTVDHLWQDDPNYVLKNSREDLARRLEMFTPKLPETEPNPLLNLRASRQAGSMFDPVSNTVDYLAGLSVSRYIHFMTMASTHPDVSEQQRKNFMKIATRSADNILLGGLVDPLDGGVFSGVQQSTEGLPVFTKTLEAQSSAMQALYALYQQTTNPVYRKAADAATAYLETNLTLPDGGYALGKTYASHGIQDNPCIWTLEEIEAALTEEETKLCVQAFEISGLGNIPLIDDRNRSYFRKNILSWRVPIDRLATLTGRPVGELETKMESITKKLAKLRTEKTGEKISETLSTATDSAAVASAYVTAYRATGDPAHLEKARHCLGIIQEQFVTADGELKRARYNGQLLNAPALAIDYASICQAALDLHEATLDASWLEWATELHRQMNRQFANADFTDLVETQEGKNPRTLTIRNYITLNPLNNRSTWAIAYSNARRLALRLPGSNYSNQADQIEQHIQAISAKAPLANIDYLTADARLQQKSIYLKSPVSPALLSAAISQPAQVIAVTAKGSYPELEKTSTTLKPGQAVVIQRGQNLRVVSNPQDLDNFSQ